MLPKHKEQHQAKHYKISQASNVQRLKPIAIVKYINQVFDYNNPIKLLFRNCTSESCSM